MSRQKAISVKIATVKVIKALETSLEKLKKDFAGQAANEAKFQKAHKEWASKVAELGLAQIKKADSISTTVRYDGRINIDFYLPAGSIKLPEEPQQDFLTMQEWQYNSKVDEIENAIRILKMTDDEVVSTSTYNAIAQYL